MNEFPFNKEVASHTMGFAVHLGSRNPRLLLLNASIDHLLNYGRPIFGGTVIIGPERVYIKELEGIEPTYGYNLDELSGSDVEAIMKMDVRDIDETYSEYTVLLYNALKDRPGPVSWLEIAQQQYGATNAMLEYIKQRIENNKLKAYDERVSEQKED